LPKTEQFPINFVLIKQQKKSWFNKPVNIFIIFDKSREFWELHTSALFPTPS